MAQRCARARATLAAWRKEPVPRLCGEQVVDPRLRHSFPDYSKTPRGVAIAPAESTCPYRPSVVRLSRAVGSRALCGRRWSDAIQPAADPMVVGMCSVVA